MPHPSFVFVSPAWARTAGVAVVALALSATLAACSTTADDDTVGSDTATSVADDTTTDDSTSSEESAADEDEEAAAAAGSYTSDDVGNATLYIGGVEFPDFTGDCEISRGHGTEDVGDLNDGDIVAIIAVDNTAAHEDTSMNYIALNEESFRFRDLVGAAGVGNTAEGEITTMTEQGPRSADGSRDIVEVRFAGTFEDGTAIDADIVCELQNTF
ncbi:hypothetical protein [Microbacterium marmarense]|uniref:Lipoprotein n=1 Tax=Microbacterium marmarense TaxID=3122051 RepID=A0ABU8LUQ3_9MICO